MNKISRTITGIVFYMIGIALIVTSFFYNAIDYVSIVFGIGILILGFFIFFNKNEDVIEKVNG